MDKTSFPSLSQELILAICEDLNLNDLKGMRLTCKTLANDVAYLIFSHICIPKKGATTIEEVVSDLQFLPGNCPRKITIDDFSSMFLDSSPKGGTENGNANVPLALDSDPMKKISQDFLTALTSFNIVRTVNWYPGRNDPLWLQEIIWDAIRLFPNLRHFTIDSSFLKQPLGNFNTLNALESINIFGAPFEHNGALFISLSKLYASSSNLYSITIKGADELYDVEQFGDNNLRQLFSSNPQGNPVRRLRSLALTDVPVRLDEVVMSHLTNLTSFKLPSLPYAKGADLNSTPDDIWVAFRSSRICLEELEVGYELMADSLHDYLSSFSGLKKLKLSIPTFDARAPSEASAVRFWSESFPNHVDTLQDFSLHACYDGQWCFGHHNRSLIAKCTKLEQLTISVMPADIPSKESDFNGIDTVINTVVTNMLHIKNLCLEVPILDTFRRARCGTGMYGCRARDGYRLMDWVLAYQPPASCQHLPQLTVNCDSDSDSDPVRVFVGIRNARRSRLKYTTSSVITALSKRHQ